MTARVKRSPLVPAADDAETELVQTRISKKARELLDAKVKGEALSVASHIRRVLYRDLGLIKGE